MSTLNQFALRRMLIDAEEQVAEVRTLIASAPDDTRALVEICDETQRQILRLENAIIEVFR